MLSDTFAALINHPEVNIPFMVELFEFKVTLIPKKSGNGFRPIAVEETILKVMHSHILNLIRHRTSEN